MKTNRLIVLIFAFILLSCDGGLGLEGTTIDQETQEPIEGVHVEITSEFGNKSTQSLADGNFKLQISYSCGIKKCDDNFTVSFEKEGYKKLILKRKSINKSEVVELEQE